MFGVSPNSMLGTFFLSGLILSGCQSTKGVTAKVSLSPQKLVAKPLNWRRGPTPRAMHSSVWNGKAMVVLGGITERNSRLRSKRSTGGLYYPGANKWSRLNVGPELNTYHHSLVSTDDGIAIWGGIEGNLGDKTNKGYLINADFDGWYDISLDGAPTPRSGQGAVWSGDHLIVWGGEGEDSFLGDGGIYDPDLDTWQQIPTTENSPAARAYHSSIYLADKLLVWGGLGESGTLGDGGVFNFATNEWRPVAEEGAPAPRYGHSAVWTGSHLVIWGGQSSTGNTLRDGAMYDPKTELWTALSLQQAPMARELHSAVWTGDEMIVWGGSSRQRIFKYGAAFNPTTNTWRPLRTKKPSIPRYMHSAVWYDGEMIIYGGRTRNGRLLPPKKAGLRITLKERGKSQSGEDQGEEMATQPSPPSAQELLQSS